MKEDQVDRYPDEESIVDLFDQKWFAENVFFPLARRPDSPPLTPPPPPPEKRRVISSEIPIPDLPVGIVGRHSWPEKKIPFSPDSTLRFRRMETILSQKNAEEEDEAEIASTSRVMDAGSPVMFRPARVRRKGWRASRSSRSLSELEFEEVKGFMDLGFVFPPAADVSPALAKIVPGLQRLGEPASPDSGGIKETEDGRQRPYLSEAWEYGGRNCPLRGWRLPADLDGDDMKESLRTWAHRIGSAVR